VAQHAEVHYPGAQGMIGHMSRRLTRNTSLTITIAAGLKQRERNSALMHEVVHLERGSVHSADTEREEQVVCEETARRLIPLTALTDALRWTRDLHQLAIELHCTVDVVSTRLATMHHPAERAAVRRVLDDVEHP